MTAGRDYQPEPPAEAIDWGPVLAFLPLFSDPDLDAGRPPSVREQDGEHSFVGAVLSADAGAFVELLYELNVVAGFDWPGWMRAEGRRLAGDPRALSEASLEDCRRLLAAHVRADRFTEGHLLGAMQSGAIAAVLQRIAELVRDPEPGAR